MSFCRWSVMVVLWGLHVSCQKQPALVQSFSKIVVGSVNSNHDNNDGTAQLLRTMPTIPVMESIMVCTKKGEARLTAAMKKAEQLLQEKHQQYQQKFPHAQVMSTAISKVQNVQRGQSQGDCIVSRDFDLVHINVLIQYSYDSVREVYLQLDTLYIDSRYYLLDIHDHDG